MRKEVCNGRKSVSPSSNEHGAGKRILRKLSDGVAGRDYISHSRMYAIIARPVNSTMMPAKAAQMPK